jgi:penicillin-binding protein-related factor A (putative recombinase)
MENLPQFKNKREAYKTTDIVKWVRENIKHSCLIEVKQTKTNTLYANSIKEHQLDTLLKPVYTQKLSDALMQRQPADIIHFYNPQNYLIIIFGDNTRIKIPANKIPPINQKITLETALQIGEVF